MAKRKKKHEVSLETRKNIVDSVMKNLAAKPENLPAPPDELEQLQAKRDLIVQKVIAILKPMIDQVIVLPVSHPHYAHTQSGRANVITQGVKLYLDGLKSLDSDEILWLLAFEYSMKTVEEFL
jgi:hypothetical protein